MIFPSSGEGKLIPHGLYDLARNEGYMYLNTSHDTREFCCDSIAQSFCSLENAVWQRLDDRSRMSGDVQVRICEHLRGAVPLGDSTSGIVTYSGRSAISAGPHASVGECEQIDASSG